MRIIGLTGGIGSGKTTVARLLETRGATVIDVDAVGRAVIAPGGTAEAAVAARFGDAVLDESGGIDRRALAAVVFSDPDALDALEAISHPAIDAELDRLIDAADPDAVVVLDMAVLAESDLGKHLPSGRGYDTVVVVEAPLDQRLDRLVGRGHTVADARARMASQATDEQRRAIADHVIVNDGDLDALDAQVQQLWVLLGEAPSAP